jgi:hypothetical protein
MKTRIHIERLVIDARVLAPDQAARFQTELAAAVSRRSRRAREMRERPRDAVARLADRAAAAILERSALSNGAAGGKGETT